MFLLMNVCTKQTRYKCCRGKLLISLDMQTSLFTAQELSAQLTVKKVTFDSV